MQLPAAIAADGHQGGALPGRDVVVPRGAEGLVDGCAAGMDKVHDRLAAVETLEQQGAGVAQLLA